MGMPWNSIYGTSLKTPCPIKYTKIYKAFIQALNTKILLGILSFHIIFLNMLKLKISSYFIYKKYH